MNELLSGEDREASSHVVENFRLPPHFQHCCERTGVYRITFNPELKSVCIFFRNCNFKCKGCIRKNERIPSRAMPMGEVLWKLSILDASLAIFMGGEPTVHDEMPEIAEFCKEELGMRNVLLTNAYSLTEEHLFHFDDVCISLKAISDEIHRDFTGFPNRRVLKNFIIAYNFCKNYGLNLRAESIFIPLYIDCDEIRRIARFISEIDDEIPYRIDAYVPVRGAIWRSPRCEEMEEALKIAKEHLRNVSCLFGNEKEQGRTLLV